jgi:hypothetical protein
MSPSPASRPGSPNQAGRLQHGRIQWYLIYSFATLIFLLVFDTGNR